MSDTQIADQYPPVNAVGLTLAHRQLDLNLKNIKTTRTWFPSPLDLVLGPNAAVFGEVHGNSYFHSVWVGVLGTLINLPGLVWHGFIKTVLGGLLTGTFRLLVMVLTPIVYGVLGRAIAVQVDSESFHKEAREAQARAMMKFFATITGQQGVGGGLPPNVRVIEIGQPQEAPAEVEKKD